MRFMKNILLFVMSLASVLPLAAKPHGDAVGRELFRLDSLIAQKPSLEAMKEQRIDRLRRQRKRHMTAEQEFMLNELFYKEFSIYDADSALRHINRNIALADSMGWGERKVSYRIKKSHVLAATGLLKEASDEVRGLGGQAMSKELSVEYYGQMVYLYSHFGQYMGEGASNRAKYHALETLYKDSVCAVISPEHPDYLWHQGNRLCGTGQTGELMKELNGNKQMTDVWHLPAIGRWEKSCGKHPTQKPLAVLSRLILASTRPGAWILDPFSGSATTGIAANLLERRYLGLEIEEEFLLLLFA